MPRRAGEPKETIAVAASFTAEPIEDYLRFWMEELDFEFRIEFAPYNQVFQQLLDPQSLVSANGEGINVLLLRLEDWLRHDDDRERELVLKSHVQDLRLALDVASQRSATPYLIVLCPASTAAVADAELLAVLDSLEELLAFGLEGAPNIHLVKSSDLERLYPVEKYYQEHSDAETHIPYTPACFSSIATMIARRIYGMRSDPYKVIVLDCDYTLWKGVCGEDGAMGIKVEPPWRFLQEFMVAQHDAGMLICLCSKNNEADVLAVFDLVSDLPLKRGHITSYRLNWNAKSENIRSLSRELGLGLDAFIFIDDNPVECAEMAAHCPEVLTLQLPPEPQAIEAFLTSVWAFDHWKTTAEDRNRTVLYRQDLQRALARKQSLTLDNFFARLELRVNVTRMMPHHVGRASDLTRRTNQFNFQSIRRSEGELERLRRMRELDCFVVDVTDRFGSYGIVGLMVFEKVPGALSVDTFLLSCRALGKGVEHRMLAKLAEIAKEKEVDRVEVRFIPTERNRPAYDFLESVGSGLRTGDNKGFVYTFPAEEILSLAVHTHSGELGRPVQCSSGIASESKKSRAPLNSTVKSAVSVDSRYPSEQTSTDG